MVGIGASAGGLEALKAFFGAMPPKSGLVFVVVVHLDPTHESLMPELLARATALSVEAARDRQPLEADHVYIIPPNRTLTLEQGLLHVEEVVDRRGLRGSIDHFFRSLAEDQGDRAVAIVLSGTGTEGTLGARAVKAEGGMVMAQAPETASQPGMPSGAIAAGLVDLVLPPEKMPGALLEHVRGNGQRRVVPAAAETKALDDLSGILTVLRARTKYDFRGYKKGTIRRRIERRMGLQQFDNATKYADFVRSHPAEADQLLRDLLIGVTSFFRDPAAFDALGRTVVAQLLTGRDPDRSIRVWVPGCSTGEEAYSVAIVFAEQIAAAQSACRVQIFATDVDEHALEIARGGAYPESIALDVTPERLHRFFTHEDHRYVIAKSIRQSVTFAAQNLISDPPFSKLDLVSCRNVLIYLEPEIQQKLVALFHFALNRGGYLFLGSAEGVGPHDDLFAPVSRSHRIFQRLGPVRHLPLEFPVPRLASEGPGRETRKPMTEPAVAALADQQLLEHFAPAAVVVRRTGEIVRFYGPMDRYIRLPTGEATLDVLALARDALKPSVRAVLHDAVRHNRAKVYRTLDFKRQKGRSTLYITVRPVRVPRTVENLWFMIFEELPMPVVKTPPSGRSSNLTRKLEAERRATKRDQQHLIEQLESGNEELKAANEEILSMNEELQSTNEELVTSREELQSMNEELTTLNGQLQEKVLQLTALNDDLANLLVSTDIATVFVDNDFRIKRFTTAATHLLNLLPSDLGRPIAHLATNLVDTDLARDARAVLSDCAPIEKEVAAQDGTQYLVRMLPYRTADQHVQGVVLTLVDVTTLKQTEHELRRTRDELRRLNQTLEERVSERTSWLMLMHDATRALNDAPSWDEALHLVLNRIRESQHWQVGFVYLPDRDTPDAIVPAVSSFDDDRFRSFTGASERQRYGRGQSLPGRVYADGAPVWVNGQERLLEALPFRRKSAGEAGLKAAAVLPIRFGREVIAVLELFSDQPHEPNELLENLMNDLSAQIGKVVERERATAQMADLVWREQQGLLHTLHDSLGQTLTGLGMLSTGLRQQLAAASPPGADAARQIAEQAQLALEQVRQLSRGLFPVEIDPEALLPALRELAVTTEAFHKVRVQVEGELPGAIRDTEVATQLYRIAQEAVTNAVKHSHARTIRIEISALPGLTKLRIADDGVGIAKDASSRDGLGMRIMRYRATSIGALLSVQPGSEGGTVVVCTLRDKPVLANPGAIP
ncbi:MAG: chemotaxis protein CheB [Betaproteobacteria bacterium]